MKRILTLLAALVCLIHVPARAQDHEALVRDIAFYGDVMSNAVQADHRLRAQEEFSDLFRQWLELEDRPQLRIDSLAWVKRVAAKDDRVVVYTWQVEYSPEKFGYFGFIEQERPSGAKAIFELSKTRSLRSEFGRHTCDTWYGAMYYGMREFRMPDGGDAYLLIGFNSNNAMTNMKVADILLFEGDEPVFGADLFKHPEGVRSRIIIEYSDAASGRMQFDPEKQLLVYDNIIVFEGGPDGPILVPDGSYRAFELKGGEWEYIDKLFLETVDEPPGEGIPDDGVERDILGRKRD